jgi:hypothetical protein
MFQIKSKKICDRHDRWNDELEETDEIGEIDEIHENDITDEIDETSSNRF